MYPDGLKRFYGSALPGYNLNYISEDMTMDLFFQTNIDKTIDQADKPLNFTTYERSYGTLHGSIFSDCKRYTVTHAKGYMDLAPSTNHQQNTNSSSPNQLERHSIYLAPKTTRYNIPVHRIRT